MDLKNKLVIITGASSGIGRACAEAFAAKGANLIIAARQFVTLCEITADLQTRYGIKAIAVETDVSKEADCKHLINQALLSFGRIDCLVNNAGITMKALFKDLDLEVLEKVMNVNFWGTVYCTKYALPEILKTSGTIVGVSSIAGFKGLPGRTGYSASKFAMNGFLDALRIENLKNNINIMIACPGFTTSNIRNVALNSEAKAQGETSMDEDKMMGADEVAARIVKGVEQKKRLLIMTGKGKITVLVQKFMPAFMDKLIYKEYSKEKDALIK